MFRCCTLILKNYSDILEEKVLLFYIGWKSENVYRNSKKKAEKVAHVVSSVKFAKKKCQEAGVDAVVAEGFEAGGHNGREETTTLSLIPKCSKKYRNSTDCSWWNCSRKQMKATMI